MYHYRATVDRVIDGDTVDLIVDLGFATSLKVRVRLLGVDTPERGHPHFGLSSEQLDSLLRNMADPKGYVYVRTEKTGKYGRWLGVISDREGDIVANDIMRERWPG